MKNGLLLINLGTPDNYSNTAVRRFLKEFLADRRVINLPSVLRYCILYAFILPFRPQKTARAYKKIWTKDGSPLLHYSYQLQANLAQFLGEEWQVALGMCYGNPSIKNALEELKDCQTLTILPLYPQYSSAATGAALEKTFKLLEENYFLPSMKIISSFYDNFQFISAFAALIKPYLGTYDHLLFSYHGLPERHLHQLGCNPICSTLCPPMSTANPKCYKAQCYATTEALVKQLGLEKGSYSVSFQSRLGKTAWLQPYLNDQLKILANQGVKRLAVVCPSFVADCLETLEEIGIQARETWQKLGGAEFAVIPCINANERWVEGLAKLILE